MIWSELHEQIGSIPAAGGSEKQERNEREKRLTVKIIVKKQRRKQVLFGCATSAVIETTRRPVSVPVVCNTRPMAGACPVLIHTSRILYTHTHSALA
jgi:hypothetical protein